MSKKTIVLANLVVIFVLTFLISVPVCAEDISAIHSKTGSALVDQTGTSQDNSEDNTRFNVSIDPVSDHFIGDSMVVQGTAQMLPGEKILVEIQPALSHPPG